MFKKRRLGLQFKITFLIVAILFGMLVIKELANMFLVKDISEKLYGRLIKKTLEFDASYIQGLVEGPLERLDGSKSIVQKLLNDDSINNSSLEDIMEFFLESSPNNIAASGIVFLDNAFDDIDATGSLNGFSSYVSRNPDGSIANRGFAPEEIDADWYIEPLTTGEVYITDLYYFNVGGEDLLMYTWSEPLFDNNNRPIGVMTVDVLASNIQKNIQDSINLEGAELTVINHVGSVVSIKESFRKSIGKNIYEVFPTSEEYDVLGKKDNNEYFSFITENPVTKEDTLYAMLPINIGNGYYWDSILSIPKKDLYSEANVLIKTMMTIAAIMIVVLAISISFVIRKKFTFIMGLLVRDFKKFSNGDLTLEIPPQVLSMNDEWGDIAHSFNSLIAKINEVVIQVKNSSLEIKGAANEIADGNLDLSKRTEMQAASVEETSSSMEQMASIIKNSSSNSIEANEMMIASKDAVKEAGAIILDTTSNIEDVLEASSKIENITKIIENIAFQTNILALNAAVEAARAGEQGRGFAVVASEVRNLAQTTQTSVKDITALVADVNEKIKKSTDSAYRSKTIFDEIEVKIEKGSKLISEISTTAVEQQSGIEEVNKAISEIDMAIQQNAALVEEATASSEALLSQAKKLVNTVNFFKTKD